MLKTLCDRCGTEILPKTLSGVITRKVEVLPIIPIPGLKGPQGMMVRREVHEEALDLCKDCIEEIWKFTQIKKDKFYEKKTYFRKH